VDIVNKDLSNCFIQGSGKTIRRIFESDVNFKRIVSSEVLSVNVGAEEQGSALVRSVRVRKTVQSAEIIQYRGTFTTTTLEPVDVNDREEVKMVSVMCGRRRDI